MRIKKPSKNGAGQQCCYDETGKLITHGSGAGSADKVSPEKKKFGEGGHQRIDVDWADLAEELDGGSFGVNSQKYLEVRPANNKNKCPKNP